MLRLTLVDITGLYSYISSIITSKEILCTTLRFVYVVPPLFVPFALNAYFFTSIDDFGIFSLFWGILVGVFYPIFGILVGDFSRFLVYWRVGSRRSPRHTRTHFLPQTPPRAAPLYVLSFYPCSFHQSQDVCPFLHPFEYHVLAQVHFITK